MKGTVTWKLKLTLFHPYITINKQTKIKYLQYVRIEHKQLKNVTHFIECGQVGPSLINDNEGHNKNC